MFGMNLVTPQTGPSGKTVQRIYIENGSDIKKEFYLSCLIDRSTSKVAFIVSKKGGMDIEAVAEETPDEITTVYIDPSNGVSDENIIAIANSLELTDNLMTQLDSLIKNLYEFFIEKDASLLEINPLIISDKNELICLDAKVNFDDNGLFRHPEITGLRDLNEENPEEIEASNHDLSYIKLDGNIGCMVNGAGLAMATMDIIKLYGEEPANFLDVGGGASKEKVSAALKIILSDKNVKGILINIFGGIMRCDVLAQGVVDAAKQIDINIPIVVRLAGTNFKEGKEILDNSGLKLISANNLDDAALKIVEAIK